MLSGKVFDTLGEHGARGAHFEGSKRWPAASSDGRRSTELAFARPTACREELGGLGMCWTKGQRRDAI